MCALKLELVQIKKPDDETNVIIGSTHFIKSVEDIYEAIITSVPNIKFGIGFCEASGDRLVRFDGNDETLKRFAYENAMKIGAGHSFIILLKLGYPINIMKSLKNVDEILDIKAASANPLQVIICETDQGRAVIGVVDGNKPLGIETEQDKQKRIEFLRKIGYKL